jgi:hypothetical protein
MLVLLVFVFGKGSLLYLLRLDSLLQGFLPGPVLLEQPDLVHGVYLQ